jgi:hypothetical protein
MYLANGTQIHDVEKYLKRRHAPPEALYREDGTVVTHPLVYLAILNTQAEKERISEMALADPDANKPATYLNQNTLCKFFSSAKGNRCTRGNSCRYSQGTLSGAPDELTDTGIWAPPTEWAPDTPDYSGRLAPVSKQKAKAPTSPSADISDASDSVPLAEIWS